MVRISAAASFPTFDFITESISPPPSRTGCDAPVLVPGAIAAMSPASSRKKPAEAARAPEGPVHMITGTGEWKILSTMSRVASMKPPGVLRRISRASACSRSAWAIADEITRTVTGWTMPSIETSTSFAESDAAQSSAARTGFEQVRKRRSPTSLA